ncbi:hypothetical protein PHYPSEUDO_006244 [Phytophthora pseudosyringae]|uniref:Uncharacterized protein n=1 Tax=Phytophthora pseudosyringae TaxID=221518 RepID=A0A8T1VMJ9_9STRA|nr:hypothetical protein PHYPSEUDO_006244 [Phytophthora pseudosyringae]
MGGAMRQRNPPEDGRDFEWRCRTNDIACGLVGGERRRLLVWLARLQVYVYFRCAVLGGRCPSQRVAFQQRAAAGSSVLEARGRRQSIYRSTAAPRRSKPSRKRTQVAPSSLPSLPATKATSSLQVGQGQRCKASGAHAINTCAPPTSTLRAAGVLQVPAVETAVALLWRWQSSPCSTARRHFPQAASSSVPATLAAAIVAANVARCVGYTTLSPSRDITSATRLNRIARYNKSGTMNKYVSPPAAPALAAKCRAEAAGKCDEMDAALMVFVNCLGAVIMISVVGFHYLTAKPKDAEL